MLRSFPMSLLCLLLGCSSEPREGARETISLEGQALGTTWTVKVHSAEPVDLEELRHAIVAEIEEVETILSHWRPDAELYQFNRTLTTEPVAVHPLLHELLQHARRMNEQSLGAFDPTLAPLINLWGFGPVNQTRAGIPGPEEIKQAQNLVGMNLLEILPQCRARKRQAGLQVDLSGSAKGEIIDQVCALLDHWGLDNYLVEIGGEIRARGKGKAGQGWVVGLEDGSDKTGTKMASVPLRNYAVASSGTYRLNKTNPDSNKTASHLLDPRTGRPVGHDLVAVNAFAPTARDADAWATALMILGLEEGMNTAGKMDLVARFCVREGNETKILFSPAYDLIFR